MNCHHKLNNVLEREREFICMVLCKSRSWLLGEI